MPAAHPGLEFCGGSQKGLSWARRPLGLVAKAVGPAPGHPLLASDPRQGWAFAALSVRGFFTAPTLGVHERGAQKMDPAAVGVALGVRASRGLGGRVSSTFTSFH